MGQTATIIAEDAFQPMLTELLLSVIAKYKDKPYAKAELLYFTPVRIEYEGYPQVIVSLAQEATGPTFSYDGDIASLQLPLEGTLNALGIEDDIPTWLHLAASNRVHQAHSVLEGICSNKLPLKLAEGAWYRREEIERRSAQSCSL